MCWIWWQSDIKFKDFWYLGDQPWYHNIISTVMSQKLQSVLRWCICDAIMIQILNKLGGFFFVFLRFLQVKEMEWWHFFLLGTWWRRRWEAQTIFLHNSFLFLHFLQVKEIKRHKQTFYTIAQDWAHPIIYTIEKSKSPI
jgi:hypothetical protein